MREAHLRVERRVELVLRPDRAVSRAALGAAASAAHHLALEADDRDVGKRESGG
jgi:hypothetical protein